MERSKDWVNQKVRNKLKIGSSYEKKNLEHILGKYVYKKKKLIIIILILKLKKTKESPGNV